MIFSTLYPCAMKLQTTTPLTNNQYVANPAFCGYTRTKFGRAIDSFIKEGHNSDSACQQLNTILNLFLKHLSFASKLGEGFRGIVYKIDDKYVLKVNKHIRDMDVYPKLPEGNIFKGLKSYYGASVVDFNKWVKVLKNVTSYGKHIQAGVPDVKEARLTLPEKAAVWSSDYLPRFASLPQKCYDALAHDFAALNKVKHNGQSYAFDTNNPNNFVLAGKSLRIVDDVDPSMQPEPNTVAGLLRSFLEKIDLDYKAPMGLDNVGLRHSLMKKIIMAGEKYELPYMRGENDLKTWNYVCGEDFYYRDVISGLQELRRTCPDKKLRLEKVKEFLDKEVQVGYNSFYE